MEEVKTLYIWCMLNNIRPLGIDLENETQEGDDFMLKEIGLTEFMEFLKNGNYKENSVPRKPKKYLELRMYGFVPYNLSEIQKGIQFGHAVARYGRQYGTQIKDAPECEYIRWVDNWETFIILNGGTSNEGNLVKQGYKSEEYYGTMQQHLTDIVSKDIRVASFYEPDLNSMLSAICFLADERVFNRKLYPDYVSTPLHDNYTVSEFNEWSKNDTIQYAKWVKKVGGEKNVFKAIFIK